MPLVGSWTKAALLEVQEYVLMLGKVTRASFTRPIYGRDIVEQFEAIGVGSLTVVLLTGMFTGNPALYMASLYWTSSDSFSSNLFARQNGVSSRGVVR